MDPTKERVCRILFKILLHRCLNEVEFVMITVCEKLLFEMFSMASFFKSQKPPGISDLESANIVLKPVSKLLSPDLVFTWAT